LNININIEEAELSFTSSIKNPVNSQKFLNMLNLHIFDIEENNDYLIKLALHEKDISVT
jgi:hypothetical protein